MRAPRGPHGGGPRPTHMGGGPRGGMGRSGHRPPPPPRGGMHTPPPPRRSVFGGYRRRPASCMGCLVYVLGAAGLLAAALMLL